MTRLLDGQVSERVLRAAALAERRIEPVAARARSVALTTQARVLEAFHAERVSQADFAGSTGYGYGDAGRERLERVFARAFQAEAAFVRPHLSSGTHAIFLAMLASLAPRRTLVAVGRPYDTLATAIGLTADGPSASTLLGRGFGYREVAWADASPLPSRTDVVRALGADTGAVFVQRSRGYAARPSLGVEAIAELIGWIRAERPDVPILVDNCYGEFVETDEPTAAGADLVAGSLIKNPGGGLAPTGGYVCGRLDLVERVAELWSAPGIGGHVGSHEPGYRVYYQGLFLAPHAVSQAVQGMAFAAALFEALGLASDPGPLAPRVDIVQRLVLPSAAAVVAFCQAIQRASPVDGHVRPEPWAMPGYRDPVVMAAGTFIQGGSLELTADAPLRPPFTVYLQGGLTFEHAQLALISAAEAALDASTGRAV